MTKQKYKAGRISTRDKNAFQDNLRLDKLSDLQKKQKSKLKTDEKNLLNASTAMRASRSSFAKAGRGSKRGKFFDKNYRIKNNAIIKNKPSGSNMFDNFNNILNTSNKISVAGMIDTKSPTGVLSQKDVSSALGGFVKKIKSAAGITGVDVLKNNNKITGLNVKKEFMKTSFNFDPKKLVFETKGWNVDIPEEYIKKSDTHYVAPTRQFKDKYRYEKDGRDRDKDYQYGSYNPVEIFLNDSGNKLSKVLKKSTYTKYSKEEEDDDRSKTIRDKDMYTRQIKEYFGAGLLKRDRKWDDYTIYKKEEEKGRDYEEEKERRGVYLRSDLEYNPTGTKKSYKYWDDYVKEEEEEQRGYGDTRDEEEKEEGAIYLKRHETYDDKGRLTRRKSWDDYVKEKEEESSRIEYEKEIERGTFLERDEFFDKGKLWRRDDYDEVATGYESGSRDKVAKYTDTGALKGVSSYGFYKRNKDFLNKRIGKENLFNYKNDKGDNLGLGLFKTEKFETNYSTMLDDITFYDPLTGKVIERLNYR